MQGLFGSLVLALITNTYGVGQDTYGNDQMHFSSLFSQHILACKVAAWMVVVSASATVRESSIHSLGDINCMLMIQCIERLHEHTNTITCTRSPSATHAQHLVLQTNTRNPSPPSIPSHFLLLSCYYMMVSRTSWAFMSTSWPQHADTVPCFIEATSACLSYLHATS